MPVELLYHVCVVDSAGALRLRKVQASSESDAKSMALRDAVRIVSCTALAATPLSPGRWLTLGWRSHRLMEPISFAQDMATLLGAGVTIKDTLQALQQREAEATRKAALGMVAQRVMEGQSLAQALDKAGAFPPLLIATVAASEETGDLATGLTRYAAHQANLRAVRDKVVGACIYPGLLLLLGSLVIALLMGVVVPRFATLMQSSGRELPWLSRQLLQWGSLVDAHGWIAPAIFSAVAAVIAWLVVVLRNPVRRKWLLAKLPALSKVVREFQYLQMFRTAAILNSRGVPIHRAFSLSSEFLQARDSARMERVLSMMRDGQSVSAAFAASELCDVVAISMLSVAERTAAMPEMLDRIADFYERTLQRNIDLLSRLIEPVLMIVLGLVIGGIVVLMYFPIFDLASSIN